MPSAFAAPASALGRCRILGLDPGSHRTGYGIVDCDGGDTVCVAQGRIDARGASLALRLRQIHEQVAALFAAFAPDEVAIERVFLSRNVDSALKLGQARGAALCAVPAASPVFEYAPRAIKLAAVGFGAAEKPQVAHMVRQLLRLDVELTADASDALAVALCHAHERRAAAWFGAARVAAMPGGASPA